MQNPWRCFEETPGLSAVPAIWRAGLGKDFEIFKSLCLEPTQRTVGFHPCPLRSSCGYWLAPQPDGSFAGTCERKPIVCPPATFTLSDITPLQLDWQKLSRALCGAFEIVTRITRFTLPATWQFGAWSDDDVPLIMTIQFETTPFRYTIAELALRLHRPFILFAPTNLHIDAHAQELLSKANAGFFPLDNTVRVTDHGTLCAVKRPGDLFAKFTPEPKETDIEVARRAYAIAKQLDLQGKMEPPTPFTVFHYYFIEEMTTARVAKECECSKGTVIGRLKLIAARTGTHLKALRKLSTHFSKIEDELSDARASLISRNDAATM